MCDGFYFPISHATSSTNFARDAETCAASCGGDARLFYTPSPGGDVESMLDMTGRAYASFPIAFRYRKTLVQGCQCRPQPWTEAERARHQGYAAAQAPGSQSATLECNACRLSATQTTVPSFARSHCTSADLDRKRAGWNGFSDPGPVAPARSRYSWPGMR